MAGYSYVNSLNVGNSDKMIITEEYADTLRKMIVSPDVENAELALSMLENRDENNAESEKRFQNLLVSHFTNKTVNAHHRWKKPECWVVRFDSKIVIVNNKSAFESKEQALRYASLHCTTYLGTKEDSAEWRYGYGKDPVMKVIKKIFGGGKELRNYLIKHNILVVEQIL
jgi:hypothetical protein